jgi:hypothetical protein
MGNGDGKSNPFGDGKSGAVGNSGGAGFKGMSNHRGPDIPQSKGEPLVNPDSVAEGGRILHMDPPSNRQGLVGQTVKGMTGGKPFKLGGKGPSMPSENADESEGGPVGDIPNTDDSDQ